MRFKTSDGAAAVLAPHLCWVLDDSATYQPAACAELCSLGGLVKLADVVQASWEKRDGAAAVLHDVAEHAGVAEHKPRSCYLQAVGSSTPQLG